MAEQDVGATTRVAAWLGTEWQRLLTTVGRHREHDRATLLKIAAVVVVVLLALVLRRLEAAVFLGLLVASVCGLVDSRLSVVAGLLCLACCPLLLLAGYNSWLQQSSLVNYYAASLGLYNPIAAVDQMASWSYYFLCIGVVAQIIHRGVPRRVQRSHE